MRRHTRIKCSIQLSVHLSGSTAVSCNRTMRGRILPELHNSTFRHDINTIAWPSLSPDLAPIEHVRDELGRRVYQRNTAPRNVNELRQALLQEWQLIPQRRITNIINTMRQRCNACIAAGGGHSRF